jgi:hypothetical protein
MKHYLPMGALEKPVPAPAARPVACAACGAQLAFHRSSTPHFDECGFESYKLECTQCGSSLVGIIDPDDEALLVSEIAA